MTERTDFIIGITILAAVLAVWGVHEYTRASDVFATPINVKRMAIIEELDKGFLVKCHQGDQQNPNPYPYRRVSAATREDASKETTLCFEGKAGWPADRRKP